MFFDKREILVDDWYFFLLKKKRNLYNPYEKGVNKHPYLSISFILFLFFQWFCTMLDWKEVSTFVKKNLEVVGIVVLVAGLVIYSMFSTSHLKVVMKSDNEDFKFEVGVSE